MVTWGIRLLLRFLWTDKFIEHLVPKHLSLIMNVLLKMKKWYGKMLVLVVIKMLACLKIS